MGIILKIARGFSRPLSISTEAVVSDALLPCGPLRIFGKLATSLLIQFSFPRNSWSVSLNSPTAASSPGTFHGLRRSISSQLNSRQQTSRFSVCLNDYFPNPAPQNRPFPCPVHTRNPTSRSLLFPVPGLSINFISDPEKPIGDPQKIRKPTILKQSLSIKGMQLSALHISFFNDPHTQWRWGYDEYKIGLPAQ